MAEAGVPCILVRREEGGGVAGAGVPCILASTARTQSTINQCEARLPCGGALAATVVELGRRLSDGELERRLSMGGGLALRREEDLSSTGGGWREELERVGVPSNSPSSATSPVRATARDSERVMRPSSFRSRAAMERPYCRASWRVVLPSRFASAMSDPMRARFFVSSPTKLNIYCDDDENCNSIIRTQILIMSTLGPYRLLLALYSS